MGSQSSNNDGLTGSHDDHHNPPTSNQQPSVSHFIGPTSTFGPPSNEDGKSTTATTTKSLNNPYLAKHNMASNLESCLQHLKSKNQLILAGVDNYCNGTFDGVLCWPAIPANATVSLSCPPLKGLNEDNFVTKRCHEIGMWEGRHDDPHWPVPKRPSGWTDYSPCLSIGIAVLQEAQAIARGTRKLEFVGLGLSFFSLILAVCIFAFFRRLKSFRNRVHLQLMLALLLVVVIRLILYVDLVATENLGNLKSAQTGNTINTKKTLCEMFYFLLEYFKTVTFAWMFIEGFYLHNTVVVSVFTNEPQFWRYLTVGWGVPFLHTGLWFLCVLIFNDWKVEQCLGSYYLNTEFWILDGFRLLQLVVNTFFLLNIVRVLWLKVRESHSATELEQLKKSVKAALMLVPLLGIPNIMQTIPFTPTNDNIKYFAVYTYIASIFYMFQGFMIATIYCFTNREVIHVIKSTYQRYRLTHQSTDGLRRGSRAPSVFYHSHNNTLNGSIEQQQNAAQQGTAAGRSSNNAGGGKLSASSSTAVGRTEPTAPPYDPPKYSDLAIGAGDPLVGTKGGGSSRGVLSKGGVVGVGGEGGQFIKKFSGGNSYQHNNHHHNNGGIVTAHFDRTSIHDRKNSHTSSKQPLLGNNSSSSNNNNNNNSNDNNNSSLDDNTTMMTGSNHQLFTTTSDNNTTTDSSSSQHCNNSSINSNSILLQEEDHPSITTSLGGGGGGEGGGDFGRSGNGHIIIPLQSSSSSTANNHHNQSSSPPPIQSPPPKLSSSGASPPSSTTTVTLKEQTATFIPLNHHNHTPNHHHHNHHNYNNQQRRLDDDDEKRAINYHPDTYS